jgi:HEAT repeat protein
MIRLAVINALSRVPTPETMQHVFRAFEADSGVTVQAYFNIMFGLGNKIEPFVRAYLNKPLSAAKLGLLVELVGAIPLRNLYQDIVPLAAQPDKEIRIRVARTLGKLLIDVTVDTLITLSADEAWEVKAQAVKSLGKMKAFKTLDILESSLFSSAWYVRFNAGYGLAEMGEEGLRRLKKVAAQEDDRYARDMSVMVLNELIAPGEAA